MRVNPDRARVVACGLTVLILAVVSTVAAQPYPGDPRPDVSIVGPTRDPADIRDEGLKQQNEPACAVRPGDSDCIICFFNDYRTVDILGHEDAWIASATSCDAGFTWESRVVPNHPTHPVPLNHKFAADPRVAAIPGMAIHMFIVGERDSDEGKVVAQHWLENNQDDANHYEPALHASTADTGFQDYFLDKPDMLAVLHDLTVRNRRYDDDDDDDCDDDDDDDDDYHECYSTIDTITLTHEMEDPALGTITRDYPTGTLYAAYTAFFSDTRSQLLVKTSQDWGLTWSNSATPLTNGNTLVSGLTLTSLNNKVFAMWRQVGEGTNPDAMYYATTSVGGNSWSNPQKLADVCAFDQPSATFVNQVTFRTNGFPWLASDGKNVYAFYASRQGDCASGIPKIVVSFTGDGNSWSAPQLVADTPGAQFMPTAFGARGKVQFAWYDTSREMQDITPLQPFIADYIPESGLRVNRKVDVYTARITADAPGGPINVSEPIRVSQYRTVADASDPTGPLQEIEASFANAMMFSSGELSFLGDYFAIAAAAFRSNDSGGWEGNASALPAPASNLVDFFIAYADNRDVRGDVLFDGPGPNSPYTPPDNIPSGGTASLPGDEPVDSDAEGVVDFFTDPNTACIDGADLTRNSNVFGTVIRDTLRLSSPVESRPLSGILRAIPVLTSNVTDEYVPYRLYIANQPASDPAWHRASFRQKPDRPPFATTDAPVLTEDFVASPGSSVARTVFLVSTDIGATVDIQIFDGDCAAQADFANPTDPVAFASACPILGSISVGGSSNAGDMRQPDYLSSFCGGDPACADVRVTELHNPLIQNPLIQNQTAEAPLIQNPLIQNPLIQNPLIQNPLIQNPLIQNYGFETPLIQNPLIQNPLIQNPLIQNPLIQNPLIQNPLIQNSALADGVTYSEYTAVVVNDGNVSTAFNFDATLAGLATTGGAVPASQLILWKQYAYGTSRNCQYLPEARDQVVATINSLDDTLSVASIEHPFVGEASMILAPGERGFATIRVFLPEDESDDVSLSKFTVSAQAANCDEYDDTFGPPAGQEDDFYICQDQLGDDRELITLDLDTTGPTFDGLVDGETIPVPAIEANAPGGACIQPVIDGLVSASDPGSGVASLTCFNAEGDEICQAVGETGLSIPVSNLTIYPTPQPSPMTCVAVDTLGNSSEINIFVDVVDETAPFFKSFPANPTNVDADADDGTAMVNLESGVTAEDVDGVDPSPAVACSTSTGLTSTDEIPTGTYAATCTATDASGNATETPPFVVNVNDITPPVVTIAGHNPLELEAGSAIPNPMVDATDNVGVVGQITVTGMVDTSTPGSYTLTYSARDAAGRVGTADLIVNVVDTTPPSLIVPPNFVLSASANGDVVVTYDVTVADNAGAPPVVTCSPPSGATLGIGVTTVSCTASDASGNSVTSLFEVTVIDDTAPFFTPVPGPIEVSASNGGTAVVDYDVAAGDNSRIAPTVTCTPPSGSVFGFGTTTVSCTATDDAGNSASASFTVTVRDTTAPVIEIQQSVINAVISGPQGTVVDFSGNVSATDAIDPAPSLTCDPSSGSVFDPGSTPVSCTATDASGNSATAGFTVVVGYGGGDGIHPKKLRAKAGSSNPLSWAWQDSNGNNVDSSSDKQLLSIVKCNDSSMVVLDVAGDPGSSGFRLKDFVWEFNWQSDWPDTGAKLPKGEYCARVESSLTGQDMTSPPITLR